MDTEKINGKAHATNNHFILSSSQGRVHRCTHRGRGVEGIARLQEPMVRIHFPPAPADYLNSTQADYAR